MTELATREEVRQAFTDQREKRREKVIRELEEKSKTRQKFSSGFTPTRQDFKNNPLLFLKYHIVPEYEYEYTGKLPDGQTEGQSNRNILLINAENDSDEALEHAVDEYFRIVKETEERYDNPNNKSLSSMPMKKIFAIICGSVVVVFLVVGIILFL